MIVIFAAELSTIDAIVSMSKDTDREIMASLFVQLPSYNLIKIQDENKIIHFTFRARSREDSYNKIIAILTNSGEQWQAVATHII